MWLEVNEASHLCDKSVMWRMVYDRRRAEHDHAPTTSAEETVEALVALMRRCGMTPVVARQDVPGQIGPEDHRRRGNERLLQGDDI
jgi:hypothetical protein